jgi:hypothetical protein
MERHKVGNVALLNFVSVELVLNPSSIQPNIHFSKACSSVPQSFGQTQELVSWIWLGSHLLWLHASLSLLLSD